MSCACGHHHVHHDHDRTGEGMAVALARPMVALRGRLICADATQMMTALSLLPGHLELSRAEPGNLRFDLWQDEDPLVWNLVELFRDAEAFAAHQARGAESDWGRQSGDITRDIERHEVMPVIRPETRHDHAGIDALLQAAFGGPDEAALVRALREAGDLPLSLVAEADGCLLGHVALSPIAADRPALALAPVAVTPKVQGLGIGAALVRAALAEAGETPVVVLGDPAYYGRFGFVAADLRSPYAGPALQVLGDLPAGSEIRHAPAFGG